MLTENEENTTFDRGWILRTRPPVDGAASARTLLLLHGWTGDENVMWIFTRHLSRNRWVYAPRGPIQADEGGYGWVPHTDTLPRLQDFSAAAQSLMQVVRHWQKDHAVTDKTIDIMGFSQGTAMAYAVAAQFPKEVNRIAALAGFLPQADPGANPYRVFAGKKIYIAHGTKDTTIPVELAQEAVRTLQSAGAQVTYCESDAGHKLSASCLNGLEAFLNSTE